MPEVTGAVELGQKPQVEAEPQEPEEPEEDPGEAIRRQLPPKLVPRWDELTELRNANGELIEELARHGVGLDTTSVILTKFSALIDTIWDGNTARGQGKKIEMEYRFEETMATILADAAKNVTQAILAQGAHVPPALWNQMAKQQAGLTPEHG